MIMKLFRLHNRGLSLTGSSGSSKTRGMLRRTFSMANSIGALFDGVQHGWRTSETVKKAIEFEREWYEQTVVRVSVSK
ncbi:hypothetical protein P692DRAFT_20368725 [Suillus brevipes Sb2]|nr:hypothetical protein P692DRAFT_20368725 [Suillus brevipes Sb2]